MRTRLKVWLGSVSIILLAALCLTGLLNAETRELFKALMPFVFILYAIVLLWFHKKYRKPFWIFAITTYLVAFCAAGIGVNTGIPFGEYSYGPNLGVKIFDTPLVVGVNWFILIYSVGIISARLPVIKLLKAVAGSFLILLMDFVMEPVAAKLDLWHWQAGAPPLQYYVAWLAIGFFLLVFFHLSRFRKENPIAPVLYITLLLFFTVLNFLEWG